LATLGTRASGLELEGGTIATPIPHHVKKMLLVYVTGGKYFAQYVLVLELTPKMLVIQLMSHFDCSFFIKSSKT